MISPDVLRHSGSAGLFGLTMLWALFVLLPGSTSESNLGQTYRDGTDEAELRAKPHVAANRARIERRPVPGSDQPSDTSESARGATRHTLEARNRRARKVLDKLRQMSPRARESGSSEASSSAPDTSRMREVLEALEESHASRGATNSTSDRDGWSKSDRRKVLDDNGVGSSSFSPPDCILKEELPTGE